MAYEQLDGFGDAALGEWAEDRPKAFHLRRRLTTKEQERIGEPVDIRGSVDERERMIALMRDLPPELRQAVAASYGASAQREEKQ